MATAAENPGLDRTLALEIMRVTESAAVAAARLRGRGDEAAADRAAVEAMHQELRQLTIDGTVVIGEGDQAEVPLLYTGESLGTGKGPKVDIAVDPLEGTTICAKALPNALSVMAIAEPNTLLRVPSLYMDKIAIGPGYADGLVDLDAPVSDNLTSLAQAKGVPVSEITVCILDRARHAKLIGEVRSAGASLRLIGDGDIAGVIHTTDPDETGIDIYLGVGGAPEGVLAAAALRCIGGQIQGRLVITNDEQRQSAQALGIQDFNRKYTMLEMASGDVSFGATGVTDGSLLGGVKFTPRGIVTETVVMHSASGSVRWITRRAPEKAH
jgi:fructose-1,6-bisphosphatase II / sedoheptulose-1,7-bisphosphatase